MKYPEIKSDLLITIKNPFSKNYVDEVLIKRLLESKITFEVTEIDLKVTSSRGEWISSSSFINLYINDTFIQQHFIPQTKDMFLFLDQFKVFIQPISKISGSIEKTDEIKKTRPYGSFSTFYKSKDEYIFQFIFDIVGNESDYVDSLNEVFKSIVEYNSDEPKAIQESIRDTFSQTNKIKYLKLVEKKWTVLNPLIELCGEINENYRKNNDFRIKKPTIIMHHDDFRKYFILDSNWVISSDKLETFMIKPNDVSLYSNISDKNLQKAEKFYNETIMPRYKYFYGNFPSPEEQSEYYDYFELIITSLIFAYTSLEAFANICIPGSYKYKTEKDGIITIYSKEAIERKFTLRDKFKNILSSILNTPDPTLETWWNSFIDLENLRDEIIHTKQSKSEDRYSLFLSWNVFKTIRIHKDIIKYYGYFISENKKDLLDDFPYNFGYDDLFPGLTDEEGYEQSFRVLHDIPDDEK